jgi:hypothetical protein
VSVFNKENESQSDLMPNPRRVSLTYSRQKNHHMSITTQKEDDRVSTKSKKKVEFTVYDEKRKSSQSKEKGRDIDKSSKRNQTSLLSVPYPCTRNIVIDLFEKKHK